ncbi:MAG: hypothetical protein APR62_03165 [Smithella sp. SDB]|nr:MAG: hypothetical protein APR62_03165 [Smithella sp. SDB]
MVILFANQRQFWLIITFVMEISGVLIIVVILHVTNRIYRIATCVIVIKRKCLRVLEEPQQEIKGGLVNYCPYTAVEPDNIVIH